jgi:hypothetical protein
VRERIARVIRSGGTIEAAAAVVGVSERSIYVWLERGTRPGRREERYRALREAVERARAEHEAILVAQLGRAAAKGSWRAAAWLLERAYPERWALPHDRPAPEHDDPADDPLDALDELAERRAHRPRAERT